MARIAARIAVFVLVLLGGPTGCARPPPALDVDLGSEHFHLELALAPQARGTGLMHREVIAADGGMLFAYPSARPLHYGMKHCQVPIDLLSLDARGRVLATHAMRVEPPQAQNESDAAYDHRLPRYSSGGPAQYAIELRGGRLAQLGVAVGTTVQLPFTTLGGWAR